MPVMIGVVLAAMGSCPVLSLVRALAFCQFARCAWLLMFLPLGCVRRHCGILMCLQVNLCTSCLPSVSLLSVLCASRWPGGWERELCLGSGLMTVLAQLSGFHFPALTRVLSLLLEGPNPNLQFSGQPCQATAEGSQLGLFTDTCVACGCEPCCHQFLAEFSILSPIPCPSLHSEGPNPFLPGQPCLNTLPALDPPQESCCLICGSYRPLGFQPDAAVQQFLDACCKVVALRPSEALRRVLRDALEYCPYCLLQWDSNFNSHKVCREFPSCSVSGPSYFPLSFDSGVVDVEPDCSSASLFSSAESAAIRSVSRDRCTPVVSVSRRTRRRRNRRLRLVGQLSSCDDSSSGEVSAFPLCTSGDRERASLAFS